MSASKNTPQYVYAPSAEEAQELLDASYLNKYRVVPIEGDPLVAENQQLREALLGTREDLALLDSFVSHRQRCDEPDNPGCERCIVDSALARYRDAVAALEALS